MINSGRFDGLPVPEGVPEVIRWLEEQGRGQEEINYRLRDWLISRQRYWGTPFPIVYCDNCGIVPLPDSELPVVLPLDAEFTPTGRSPLMSHQGFLNTTCPTCGGPARRETDTMDTFVDSSWYWFRYTDPQNDEMPFDPAAAAKWTPVDLYCGGIEHAILHLLYARFITKVLADLGLSDHREPFERLRNQGMILAEEGTKMSKSRGTQVAPDELVREYGSDSLRLHLMYLGPWDQGGPWNTRGITGMERFIRRAFTLVAEVGTIEPSTTPDPAMARDLERMTHKTIQRATEDLADFQFNTMVAALIEFTNYLSEIQDDNVRRSAEWRKAIETLTLLMAPSTPFVAEEMWELLGRDYSIHQKPWPEFDAALAEDQEIELIVQVNGKVRDKIVVGALIEEAEAKVIALGRPRIQEHIAGNDIDRVIFVPGRLVNIVVKPRA
jgi:leucyl-tRNA synthetase